MIIYSKTKRKPIWEGSQVYSNKSAFRNGKMTTWNNFTLSVMLCASKNDLTAIMEILDRFPGSMDCWPAREPRKEYQLKIWKYEIRKIAELRFVVRPFFDAHHLNQPPIIPPIYKLIIWVLISIVPNTFQMFFFPLEHCLSLGTNYFFTFLNHFLIIYFEKEKLIYPGSRNSNQPFEQYSTVNSTLPWLIVIIPWLNVILCGSINSI